MPVIITDSLVLATGRHLDIAQLENLNLTYTGRERIRVIGGGGEGMTLTRKLTFQSVPIHIDRTIQNTYQYVNFIRIVTYKLLLGSFFFSIRDRNLIFVHGFVSCRSICK